MDFPVFLDTLAYSKMELFRAEAAQHRLINAALGPRPSRVRSLGRRLWAMAAGSLAPPREPVSSTPGNAADTLRTILDPLGARRSAHRALPPGGVNPS